MNIGENLWHDIVEKLKKEFSETTVGLWFGSATLSSLDGDSVTIIAEDDFKKSIIEKKYLPVLERMFEEVLGFKVEVRIESAAGDSDARIEERLFITSAPPARPTPSAQPASPSGPNSRSEYTFDNFVVGSSNRFAHAAAVSVANNPAETYNPLFIYGPSGLGKTHLLYAIASVVHKNHPSYNIVYIKGDQFTNELIAALQEGRNNEFRYKYRNADLFLVDDIQFIAGKESTQEEFFHTFNNLYENHHQIVLTADRPPNEMLRLEDRLKTRFEWGLIADIQPPDFETRMAIIKNKSVSLGFDLPNDVCTFIAENVTSNVRLLEGTVKKIRAYHDLDNMELTVPNVSRAIKDMYNKEKAENLPTPNLIIGEVSRFYNIEESVIRGTLKNKNTAEARQVAMYLVRKLTNLSLPDIGKEFGRDHSTVIHSLKKVEQQLAAGTGTLADNIRDITANINSKL